MDSIKGNDKLKGDIMSDIDERLDEIASHKIWLAINGVERKIDMDNELFVIIPQDILVKRPRELKQAIKQLIEEEVYTALVKELSQMLDDQIVKPEYHNLVVGKTVGYQAKLKTV